jgi:hypothetical protein
VLRFHPWLVVVVTVAILGSAVPAAAEEALPKPAPLAPYSLPWQLRCITAVTAIRSDTTLAVYEDAASRHGSTVASLLTGTLRIPHTGPRFAGLAVVVRGAVVEDISPAGRGGFAVGDPLVGGYYSFVFADEFRASIGLAVTIPVGMGGGDNPNPRALQARLAGSQARSQIDGAVFAANDLMIDPAFDVAWIAHGVTIQGQAEFFHFTRVRGSAFEGEATKVGTIFGLHVGYFFVPELSLGGEIRYQRWLNAPFAVENDPTGASRDTLTGAIGPRAHFRLSRHVWMHPGIAYQRGLDKPMAAATPNVHIVQLDIPVVF